MQISDFSIHNPVKVAVGVILLCLFGLIALFAIPVQLTPEVTKPVITVETRWQGASPQEIEKEIVDKQEEQLKSIEGMIDFKSESMDSEGKITMEFAVGVDRDATLLKVANKLDQVAEYPEDADEPRITAVNTSDSPIAWMVLMPLPPTHGELEEYIERYPHLEKVLRPLMEQEEIHVPTLTRIAEEHEDLRPLVQYRIDASRLRRFVEDKIEARFEQVPGVANSNVYGGREEEMQVIVDPAKLAARQITIAQVRRALEGQNKDTSAGDIREAKRRYVIRTLGQFYDPESVEDTIIDVRDGAEIRVGDVARAQLGHKKAIAIVRQQGVNSIAVNVQREEGANVLEVMDGVKAAIRELNEGVLATKGLYIWQVYDETHYINSATTLVQQNLFVGGALAIVVLLLFLRSGRSTLIVALAIPISVIGTFLVISSLGRSINVVSLAGMAFAVGMVVDNAIVVLENIYSHYQRGATPFKAASRGTSEVWGAILASTLTTLAVFLPVVFVQEQAGQLFRDIAIAISAAVALSLIVSLTVIPSAASRLLAERQLHHRTGDANQGFGMGFGKRFVAGVVRLTETLQQGRISGRAMLITCLLFGLGALLLVPIVDFWMLPLPAALGGFGLRVPLPSVVGLAVAALAVAGFVWVAFTYRRFAMVAMTVVLSLGLIVRLMPPKEYLPEGNRNLVIGIVLPPPGYNLDQMIEIGEKIERQLQPFWEQYGKDAEPAQPEIANFFFVARGQQIFMGAKTVDPARAGELVPIFAQLTKDIPGVFLIPSQASLFERGLSGGRKIDIEITGPEIEKLIALGGQILGEVKQMYPDETQTHVRPVPSLDLGSPELHIRRKRKKAEQRGVVTRELGYAINALVDGAYAGDYWHEGKKIDLVITADIEDVSRTQDVEQLPIGTPSGEIVPLSAVADVRYGSGPEQINRIDRERAITLEVKPGPGVPLEDAIARINTEILEPLRDSGQLEGGLYDIHLAGTADELKNMAEALAGRLLLAVVITYLLIAALYESFLYPIVIMISVPMAAVGGFAGLRLLNVFTGQAFDTLTMLGFVILIGTVVNNAILIVNQALVNIREDGMPHRQAVVESVRGRIRPIFMSTSTTVFGMLPLVLFPGAGSELYRGLGSVVLGGLAVSTVFTLFLVPMLFTLTLEGKGHFRRLVGLEEAEQEQRATESEEPVMV